VKNRKLMSSVGSKLCYNPVLGSLNACFEGLDLAISHTPKRVGTARNKGLWKW
jgi:hypothetical protein